MPVRVPLSCWSCSTQGGIIIDTFSPNGLALVTKDGRFDLKYPPMEVENVRFHQTLLHRGLFKSGYWVDILHNVNYVFDEALLEFWTYS